MICRKCGAENPVNAAFCSLCYVPLFEPSARVEMWESASAETVPADAVNRSGPAGPKKPEFAFATRLYGIVGAENMTIEQLKHELRKGGRIVRYRYSIGMLIYTFKNDSPAYLIKAGKSVLSPGIKYSLVSLLLGWWGIPMGPLYTPAVIFGNFAGGEDITCEFTTRMDSEERRAAALRFNPYESVEPYNVPDFHITPV